MHFLHRFPDGTGDAMFAAAQRQQEAHPTAENQYNEKSARISSTNYQWNDSTAIFTFTVDGTQPIDFHTHRGKRCITGVTGSGGATLVFSVLTRDEIEKTPSAFTGSLRTIVIPPETFFTLKFDGQVPHQFGPTVPGLSRGAFFAVSVHPIEHEGLTGELLAKVMSDGSSISGLTEPIGFGALVGYRFPARGDLP